MEAQSASASASRREGARIDDARRARSSAGAGVPTSTSAREARDEARDGRRARVRGTRETCAGATGRARDANISGGRESRASRAGACVSMTDLVSWRQSFNIVARRRAARGCAVVVRRRAAVCWHQSTRRSSATSQRVPVRRDSLKNYFSLGVTEIHVPPEFGNTAVCRLSRDAAATPSRAYPPRGRSADVVRDARESAGQAREAQLRAAHA